MVQNQVVSNVQTVCNQVVAGLGSGNELVVFIVSSRGVGAGLGGYVGRTVHAVGRGAVDLDADGKGGAGAGVALVYHIDLVGRFFQHHGPVGPAGVVGDAERREHDPVLAVRRRSKSLVDDQIVGAG